MSKSVEADLSLPALVRVIADRVKKNHERKLDCPVDASDTIGKEVWKAIRKRSPQERALIACQSKLSMGLLNGPLNFNWTIRGGYVRSGSLSLGPNLLDYFFMVLCAEVLVQLVRDGLFQPERLGQYAEKIRVWLPVLDRE